MLCRALSVGLIVMHLCDGRRSWRGAIERWITIIIIIIIIKCTTAPIEKARIIQTLITHLTVNTTYKRLLRIFRVHREQKMGTETSSSPVLNNPGGGRDGRFQQSVAIGLISLHCLH